MTLAKICKCGHTKTDHRAIYRKGETIRYECEWFVCKCKGFKFKESKSTNYGSHELPTLIDCNEGYYNYNKIIKIPNSYVVSECDHKGYAQNRKGYHPKRFSNGEYP